MAHRFWLKSEYALIASGAAGLIYQVCWSRLLALSLGSTNSSVVVVTAVFFGGLALGGAVVGKLRPGPQVYAGVELAIAACGALSMPALLHLPELVSAWPCLSANALGRASLASLLIIGPTIGMGMTLPLYIDAFGSRAWRRTSQITSCYGLNTAGAAVGALLAGVVLIPRLGLDGSILLAVALNCGSAVIGFSCRGQQEARKDTSEKEVTREAIGEIKVLDRPNYGVILAVTGATSMASEMAWIRYLGVFAGNTVEALGVVVASILVGGAIGAMLSAKLEKWLADVRVALAILAGALALVRVVLPWTAGFYAWGSNEGPGGCVAALLRYGIVFTVLFPATLGYGYVFSIALRGYVCAQAIGPARIGAGLAVNTAWGIVGIVASGIWLLPSCGVDGVLQATMTLVGALAVLLLGKGGDATRRLAALGIAAGIVGAVSLEGPSFEGLIWRVQERYSGGVVGRENARLMWMKEGRSSVVSLLSCGGKAVVLTNGLNEGTIDQNNMAWGAKAETLLGLLPYVAQPAPGQTALVVGYGAGTTVRALLETTVASVHVVELEPAIIEAADWLLGRGAVHQPRMHLTIDDARSVLLREKALYDIIVAQPSHPWTAGASGLFSLEFFEIVKARLLPAGRFSQWINLVNMDSQTLNSIVAAFFASFDYGCVFCIPETNDLILLGSLSDWRFRYDLLDQALREVGVQRRLGLLELERPGDLLVDFYCTRECAVIFTRGASPCHDVDLLPEVRLGDVDMSRVPMNKEGLWTEHGHWGTQAVLANGEDRLLKEIGEALRSRKREEEAMRIGSMIECAR